MNQKQTVLSKYQFGFLRYVSSHAVTLEELQTAHGTTLGNALDHKWVQRVAVGDGKGFRLVVTELGEDAMRDYMEMGIRRRLHPGPLTDHCAHILRTARAARIFKMPKAG